MFCPIRIAAAMPTPNTSEIRKNRIVFAFDVARERRLTEIVSDPDRIDRAVQRLEHARGEDRQRENEQPARNRAVGERIRARRMSDHLRAGAIPRRCRAKRCY